MKKFLFGGISVLILLSVVLFYSLVFDLWDLNFQSFAREYSWIILFTIFLIPSALLGYKKWNFLIIYSIIFAIFLTFLYFDLHNFASMNLIRWNEIFPEVEKFLQSVKCFIIVPILMLIFVIIIKILEKKKFEKIAK